MCTHHTQTGDVSMLHPVRRILLHLCEDIANNARVVIRGLLGAGDVDGDVGELGPAERMVEVVFHEIAGGG
jgi:hypothetical protein